MLYDLQHIQLLFLDYVSTKKRLSVVSDNFLVCGSHALVYKNVENKYRMRILRLEATNRLIL